MKYSGIGGQAVMEGVMMKNAEKYAVAVRKTNGEIEIMTDEYRGIAGTKQVQRIPIVRGVVNFIDSLVLGMKTLTWSADIIMDEDEEDDTEKTEEQKKKEDRQNSLLLGGTVVFSIAMAVLIFMMLPYGLSRLLKQLTDSETLIALLEGVLRLLIFFCYILLISRMKDIQRVFMYHGAEHKCINCIEHGMELTVENAAKSSRLHKRCGTSFLFIVMIVSIVFFMFLRIDSPVLRIVFRLLLIPVIAGVSYEFIRLAGRSENKLVEVLSKPGMWMQKMTTREPEADMLEVAIASVNAVFDWKGYLEKNFGESQS